MSEPEITGGGIEGDGEYDGEEYEQEMMTSLPQPKVTACMISSSLNRLFDRSAGNSNRVVC